MSTSSYRFQNEQGSNECHSATTFIGFVFFVLIFNLPLRSQTVNLDSPSTASVRLLPMLGALAVGSFLGGAASTKVNRTFHTFVVGTALVTIGTGLLSTVSPSLEVDKKIYGFEVIAGFGVGLTFSTVSLMTTKETEAEDHGMYSRINIYLLYKKHKLTYHAGMQPSLRA